MSTVLPVIEDQKLISDIILISSDSDDEKQSKTNPISSQSSQKIKLTNQKQKTNSCLTAASATLQKTTSISEDNDLPIDEVFDKFIGICTSLIKETKDASDIISFIKVKHEKSSSDFKSSLRYRNLLNRCIRKLKNGCNQEFVYINDVATVLDQHSERKRKCSSSNGSVDVLQKRTKFPNSSTLDIIHSDTDKSEDRTAPESSRSIEEQRKVEAKVEHYEKLLKKFSDEIKKLQAHELSLDEMEDSNSMYVQEAKLKKKIMVIFEKLCKIKKVPPKTGRVTEQKIKLNSSRYPEINKKVESYVNRVRKFPDYPDILYLVNQSNKKHNLQLQSLEIKNISKDLFEEVGKHLQHIRHYDFVYNFGCYLTDSVTEDNVADPAEDDLALQEKLKANRLKSKSALDDVIKKFTEKENEAGEAYQQCRYLSDKESDLGSEPPSETVSDDESEESNSEVELEDVSSEGESSRAP